MDKLKTGIGIEDCSGCGACQSVCPQKCVSFEKDQYGFNKPKFSDKCVDCGLCARSCPQNAANLSRLEFKRPEGVYSAVSKSAEILAESSSGGAFSEIAKVFCDDETVIFGAAFDGDFSVKIDCVEGLNNIAPLRKSKYVQPEPNIAHARAREFLKKGRRVLYAGTPCQIAALRLVLGGDNPNLLTLDFSCHGFGSPMVFRRYIEEKQREFSKKIVGFSFREKARRGFNYSVTSTAFLFEDGSRVVNFKDILFKGFVRAFFKCDACSKCPYARGERISDITMADFWGIEFMDSSLQAGKGVSLVLANTKKGMEIVEKLKDSMSIKEREFSPSVKKNTPLISPVKASPFRERFFESIKTDTVENSIRKLLPPKTLKSHILRIFYLLPVRMQIAMTKFVRGLARRK